MATKAKKTATDKVLAAIKKGPKKGLTALAIAERAQTNASTTRGAISELLANDFIQVVGVYKGGVGRPSNLYAAA